jgi:hypothetical protein
MSVPSLNCFEPPVRPSASAADAFVFASSCALLLESAREFALMFWAAVHLVALFISTAALGCCFRRCFPAAHTIYHQVSCCC